MSGGDSVSASQGGEEEVNRPKTLYRVRCGNISPPSPVDICKLKLESSEETLCSFSSGLPPPKQSDSPPLESNEGISEEKPGNKNTYSSLPLPADPSVSYSSSFSNSYKHSTSHHFPHSGHTRIQHSASQVLATDITTSSSSSALVSAPVTHFNHQVDGGNKNQKTNKKQNNSRKPQTATSHDTHDSALKTDRPHSAITSSGVVSSSIFFFVYLLF